jgi:ribosomal-protein-alanine N-acetyltransferase
VTIFRDLIPLDLPVVVAMEREIYPSDAWSVAQFKEELAGVPRTRKYLVATDTKGNILGYAGAFSAGHGIDTDIQTLTVARDFRRKGIGRSLLKLLIEWAQERESPAIFLEVREGNEEASPLYLSEGFEAISRRKRYYATGADAVIMRKALS